jgi:hypothetical protein
VKGVELGLQSFQIRKERRSRMEKLLRKVLFRGRILPTTLVSASANSLRETLEDGTRKMEAMVEIGFVSKGSYL